MSDSAVVHTGFSFSGVLSSFKGVIRAMQRGRMMSVMQQMDDATLASIGVERKNIKEYVNGLLSE